MLNLQLARKYSRAIFLLAQEENKLIEYGQELTEVSKAIFGQADFKAFMTNPRVQARSKKELVTKLFRENMSQTVFHFLMLLIDKKREALLEEIAREYEVFSNQARGIVIADVTTARIMSEVQSAGLKSKLEKVTGKTIRLRPHVNAAIIGGAIVRMGDKRIDGSVAGRMQALQAELLAD